MTPDGRVFEELSPHSDSAEYPIVKVRNSKTGRVAVRRHSLMADAFFGPRPTQQSVVRHLNGMPGDDRENNIAWGTQAENCADTVEHGRSTRGARNARAKITEAQAREIKRRRLAGESGSVLATEFGISQTTVCNIVAGATWAWL